MARTDRLSAYKTTWTNSAELVTVTYINTMIVKATPGAGVGLLVTLNSDGWQTVTTKRKMNQAANQFRLGFGVSQRKGQWFVDLKNPAYDVNGDVPYWLGLDFPYEDGMTIDTYNRTVSYK